MGYLEGDHRGDIRNLQSVTRAIQHSKAAVVFHLAAQALVRQSYDTPIETISTNALGTAHVLHACRSAPNVRVVVIVTTDKCYRNEGAPWPMREIDPLGGNDPYSASKACAELISTAYARSFLNKAGIRTATARAGNVLGGGDSGTDRLIPDVMASLRKQELVQLRHPNAVRPWQHVLDAVRGYARLAQALSDERRDVAPAYNFAPLESTPWTVAALTREAQKLWGSPTEWAHQNSDSTRPEAPTLRLDASMALRDLGWRAHLDTQEAIKWTVEWERAVHQGGSGRLITREQIDRMVRELGENHVA